MLFRWLKAIKNFFLTTQEEVSLAISDSPKTTINNTSAQSSESVDSSQETAATQNTTNDISLLPIYQFNVTEDYLAFKTTTQHTIQQIQNVTTNCVDQINSFINHQLQALSNEQQKLKTIYNILDDKLLDQQNKIKYLDNELTKQANKFNSFSIDVNKFMAQTQVSMSTPIISVNSPEETKDTLHVLDQKEINVHLLELEKFIHSRYQNRAKIKEINNYIYQIAAPNVLHIANIYQSLFPKPNFDWNDVISPYLYIFRNLFRFRLRISDYLIKIPRYCILSLRTSSILQALCTIELLINKYNDLINEKPVGTYYTYDEIKDIFATIIHQDLYSVVLRSTTEE
jgi:hypothetical protein